MKRLLVCALLLAVAATIAHFASDVAIMTGPQLAERSAVSATDRINGMLRDHFSQHQIQVPSRGITLAALAWFLRPGAYLISRVGIDPATTTGLCLAGFIGWWLWITVARLIWCMVARTFGLADMAHFWIWLMFVPPWRPVIRLWLDLKRWYKQFSFHEGPSAAWTSFLGALTLVYQRGDQVFLGRVLLLGIALFQQVGISGLLHLLIIAASGAGKTRWLISWLGRLHPKAAALVVDCDAQTVNALGNGLHRSGHPVHVLDPFALSRFVTASWNALDELDRAVARHGREAAVRFAKEIADAAIADDNSQQPIFAEVARQFLLGLILYVWLFEPPEHRNLVRARELAANGKPELAIDPKQEPFGLLLHVMRETRSFDDGCDGAITAVIARAASVMEGGQRAKEGNPFRVSLLAATAWLDLPEMAAISRKSDFACEDLKLGNTCVFICAPVTDVQTKLSGWVRILTVTTWYVFANINKRLRIPCALVLDEMPSLRIASLDTMAPVARKHGFRLVMITQDLEKLRQTYPKSWKGFIGNAMGVGWMGTDHPDNLETLSETLGTCLRKEKIEGGWFCRVPVRYQLFEWRLGYPHQLRQLLDPRRGYIIWTRLGRPPLKLAVELPEKALPVWAIDPDPAYGEKPLRALARWAWIIICKPKRFDRDALQRV